MSKSPTEADLIALTDNLGQVVLFREFLEFVTQSNVSTPVVYQDCSADEDRVDVIHIKAPEMKADGLTKPYDEGKHKPFARVILGEE
jgi:uncharacterized protein YrzB (UPF0473 family)